jgi:hypothetical protein
MYPRISALKSTSLCGPQTSESYHKRLRYLVSLVILAVYAKSESFWRLGVTRNITVILDVVRRISSNAVFRKFQMFPPSVKPARVGLDH